MKLSYIGMILLLDVVLKHNTHPNLANARQEDYLISMLLYLLFFYLKNPSSKQLPPPRKKY